MYKIKKKYGQHFLSDFNLLNKIVNKACLEQKNVVEIGPGKGSLTKLIVSKAKKVLAYEIDITLKSFLNFDSCSNLFIIYDDFLKRNLKFDFEKYFDQDKIYLIGNLPYYITTPLIFKFLSETRIISFTIMVQKEVGMRLLANPKNKNYNALSVIIQFFTFITKIQEIKKHMFKPSPKVDSIVLKFDKKDIQFSKKFQEEFVFFVKNAFKQKRKTLLNNLCKGYHNYNINKKKVIIFFNRNKISLNIRAEEINVEFFIKITKLWHFFLKSLK